MPRVQSSHAVRTALSIIDLWSASAIPMVASCGRHTAFNCRSCDVSLEELFRHIPERHPLDTFMLVDVLDNTSKVSRDSGSSTRDDSPLVH